MRTWIYWRVLPSVLLHEHCYLVQSNNWSPYSQNIRTRVLPENSYTCVELFGMNDTIGIQPVGFYERL
jgi:hypothetical protein